MFSKLLSPDSGLMRTMSQITDCIFLSLFWLLGSLPVLTLGAAGAALYDATYRAFRAGESGPWRRFFQVYRRSLREGLLPTCAVLALGYALGRGLIGCWNAAAAGVLPWPALCGALAVGVFSLGVLAAVFPVLSRFQNSALGLLKNTALLCLAHPARTFLLGLLTAGAGYVCLQWFFPVLFVPSLTALLGSVLLEPMFRPLEGDPPSI